MWGRVYCIAISNAPFSYLRAVLIELAQFAITGWQILTLTAGMTG